MSDEAKERALIRPSIPPLTWLVVTVWAGISVGEGVLWRSIFGVSWNGVWILGGACFALALCALFLARSTRTTMALACAGLAAGAVLGSVYWAHWAQDAGTAAGAGAEAWRVEVMSDEASGRFGSSSRARIMAPVAVGSIVTVEWPQGTQVPLLGREVKLVGSVKSVTDDQWGRRSYRSGVIGSLRARKVSDVGWAPTLRGVIGPIRSWAVSCVARVPGPGGDLLGGVLLGDRRRMAATPAETDFRTTGLTHLVAVSGSHLVVVAAVAGWLLSAIGLGRFWRSAGIAVIVGAYVVFSGVQPSAVRAWVMALAAAAAWLGGRRTDGGATLAVAAAAVLLVSPASAYDLGFRLSVAAVAGLVLLARLGTSWISPALPRRARGLAEPVSLTLAATVSTLPLTVPIFQMLSLVAPLANIAVGPIVSAVLLIGLLGLAVAALAPNAGEVVLRLAGAGGALSADLAAWLASWPHAAVPLTFPAEWGSVAAVGLIAGVWVVWPKPTRARSLGLLAVLFASISLLAVGPTARTGTTLEVLDVGQGDAVLIRDGAHEVLVDTGPSASALRAALARAQVRRLDGVVITHLHSDHAAGLPALEGLAHPGFVAFAAGALGASSEAQTVAERLCGAAGVRQLVAGEGFTVGSVEVTVVSPEAAVRDPSANESSLVLLVRSKGFSAVLTGDAESVVLDPLVEQGVLTDIDVLKVGHHGSLDAVSEPVMTALRPEYALISVGSGNRFGHPKAATVAQLSRGGSRILRTDECGDITVSIREGTYTVRTARMAARRSVRPVRCRMQRPVRGEAGAACATLSVDVTVSAARSLSTTRTHGQATFGLQTSLPDSRGAGSPARSGSRRLEEEHRRSSGPGFQPRDVRRGVRQRRRDPLGVQYAAVCVRASPCDRSWRRADAEGWGRGLGELCIGSVAHHHSGAGGQEARKEHPALQGRREAWWRDRAACT